MNNPLLTIITINFNNAEGLRKTIASVAAQSFKGIEYIVIDGGSTDGSKAVIEEYNSSLSYWVSEKDSGIYNAMNKGITKASGEYILFLNSGDHLKSSQTISNCSLAGMQENIVYGNLEFNNNVKVYPDQLDFTFFFRDSIPHPASFIRSALFESVGLYNEQHKIVSDWEFFLKAVIEKQCSYRHINETVAVYDTGGISANPAFEQLHTKERVEVLIPYMEKHYPELLTSYTKTENELNLYKNSRIHRLMKQFMQSSIYKLIKR